LMGDHFHAVIETPKPTLVAGMKWMLGTYTQKLPEPSRLRSVEPTMTMCFNGLTLLRANHDNVF
jgi:hypothetical protein